MEKEKYDRLNLLRIIAFLIVFLLHAKIFIPVEWFDNVKISWILFTPAWAGVWIFFVLSGYGIGSGFYSGKYQMTKHGILKFYYSRLLKILPLYWTYICLIVIFLKPEYLLPGRDSITKLLKLLLFNYQEEFDSTEFGLAWYMTTLLRLYLVAPLFYLLIKRYLSNCKYFKWLFLFFLIGGFIFRVAMGYHIAVVGDGNWSSDIYKPFYFNLDLFCSGFILNELKNKKHRWRKIHIIPWLGLCTIILYNSYIYFYASYYGTANIDIYCYILPSIYLIYICFIIYNYDIVKKTELKNETKNPNIKSGIIDSFAKLIMPLYLFHSTVLFCMKNGYKETWYIHIIQLFKIPEEYWNFSIGMMFTGISFVYTVILAILMYHLIMIPLNKKLDQSCRQIYYQVFGRIKKSK